PRLESHAGVPATGRSLLARTGRSPTGGLLRGPSAARHQSRGAFRGASRGPAPKGQNRQTGNRRRAGLPGGGLRKRGTARRGRGVLSAGERLVAGADRRTSRQRMVSPASRSRSFLAGKN